MKMTGYGIPADQPNREPVSIPVDFAQLDVDDEAGWLG